MQINIQRYFLFQHTLPFLFSPYTHRLKTDSLVERIFAIWLKVNFCSIMCRMFFAMLPCHCCWYCCLQQYFLLGTAISWFLVSMTGTNSYHSYSKEGNLSVFILTSITQDALTLNLHLCLEGDIQYTLNDHICFASLHMKLIDVGAICSIQLSNYCNDCKATGGCQIW